MSFILDALKKSETDRQGRGSAEFASVPASSSRRDGPPAWLWVVGGLLLINLAVLTSILMRPDVAPQEPLIDPAAEPRTATADDFANRVATARENVPVREPAPSLETRAPARLVNPSPSVTIADTAGNTALLPSLQEVQANGAVTLPELHVDIHVYSEVAEDRFVFINMVKHKEGSRLSEGAVVEEITPQGVVLSQNGITFLLPRD
jgi:general secretion pathway protein B